MSLYTNTPMDYQHISSCYTCLDLHPTRTLDGNGKCSRCIMYNECARCSRLLIIKDEGNVCHICNDEDDGLEEEEYRHRIVKDKIWVTYSNGNVVMPCSLCRGHIHYIEFQPNHMMDGPNGEDAEPICLACNDKHVGMYSMDNMLDVLTSLEEPVITNNDYDDMDECEGM
jgi:hypothetical protein